MTGLFTESLRLLARDLVGFSRRGWIFNHT